MPAKTTDRTSMNEYDRATFECDAGEIKVPLIHAKKHCTGTIVYIKHTMRIKRVKRKTARKLR